MHYIAKSFTDADIPEQFVTLAFSYLEGSERLTTDLAQGEWTPSYQRGQVAMLLAIHATELFLKACIRKASPTTLRNVHSLGELRVEFSTYFPGIEFEPPFGTEAMPADWELFELAIQSDRTAHEQLRYPVNRQNAAWLGVRSFVPNLFAADLLKLRADMERVASFVFLAATPADPA